MAISERTFTYEDLASFPEDNLRRELIGGELIVTAAPRTHHQLVVGRLYLALSKYTEEHGGVVLLSPTDIILSDVDVVEPDLLYVSAQNTSRIKERFVRGAPDVAIEVSSPSTRRLELVRKRELYLRYEIPEHWYVDLDAEEIYVDRFTDGAYETTTFARGAALTSTVLRGVEASVDEILGAP